ncbi:MAG: glutaredoxin [Nitrospina sp.]|nr:glutaredoxin [Nitrospina sp.]MBT5633134.1 glutaredoxin [Nitrospina sp.]
MPKRKIEVFSSGCPICEPTVDLVKDLACPSCEVIVYDLTEDANKEIKNKATLYGIERIPAVAVDGKLLECCELSSVSEDSLCQAGVGSA